MVRSTTVFTFLRTLAIVCALACACTPDGNYSPMEGEAYSKKTDLGDRKEYVESRRVLLFYESGFNDLASYLDSDMNRELVQGYIPTAHRNDNVLLVFSKLMNQGNYVPVKSYLRRLYSDSEGKMHSDTLLTLGENTVANSASTMREVLSFVKTRFPARGYGMVFSSHGSGWLPQGYYFSPSKFEEEHADELEGGQTGISPMEVLNLYRFAAIEADKIYWKQAFGDKSLIDNLKDGPEKDYAMINYGPWDRLTGKSFLKGYTWYMPQGACFYPELMSDEEFQAFDDPDKYSPYTLIRRDEEGNLKCVWYHEEYAEHVEKICNYLRAAADITIVPSVREYLLAEADALATDDYRNSEEKWLAMDNSRMDLVIGPNEDRDDNRFGIKRSYSAYVVLKDMELTDRVSKFTRMVGRMQEDLPCKDEYKNSFVPGPHSNIFVCDALYYSG
ncbi:MAG: clostripain-related cysteine peptidase, partial [Candidatus Cryptobacteroides sp.]